MKKIPWLQTTPVVKSCHISTKPPGMHIPREWFACIEDFDLWIILSGHAEATPADGTPLLLSRGSCLWLAPGVHYDFRVKEDELTTAWVHFDLQGPDGKILNPKHVRVPQPHGEIFNSQMFEQIIRRIILLRMGYHDGHAHTPRLATTTASHLLKSLLLEFELSQTHQESLRHLGIERHHHEIVSEALSWIHFHADRALSASEVAKKFGYSLRHFAKIFRNVTGKAPGQTIIEARIERAKELLFNSSLNITQIAEQLNYENAFYFSKQFKQITGESPSQYRSRGRNAIDAQG